MMKCVKRHSAQNTEIYPETNMKVQTRLVVFKGVCTSLYIYAYTNVYKHMARTSTNKPPSVLPTQLDYDGMSWYNLPPP